MKVAWALENSILINAPLWWVWRCMCDVLHWPTLNPVGLYGRPLGLNEKFRFTIRPLGLPINVKATVSDFRPLQVLGWQGRFCGIHSKVGISFQEQDKQKTMLKFQENLEGWGLLVFSAIFSMKRLVEINHNWLAALALQCEASKPVE